MIMLSNIKQFIFIYFKTIHYLFVPLQSKRKLYKNIPYFSQWESKELVSEFICKKVSPEKDPLWELSGAKSKLEYKNWSFNACGVACLQMILSYISGVKIPLIELANKSLSYRVFTKNEEAFQKGDWKNALPGLFYSPFIRFIKKEYRLDAKMIVPIVIKEIVKLLDTGNVVIASVSGQIRYAPEVIRMDNPRGKHLVLIVGYDMYKKIFYIHNPAGVFGNSQEFVPVSFKHFNFFSNRRGIAITLPKNRILE